MSRCRSGESLKLALSTRRREWKVKTLKSFLLFLIAYFVSSSCSEHSIFVEYIVVRSGIRLCGCVSILVACHCRPLRKQTFIHNNNVILPRKLEADFVRPVKSPFAARCDVKSSMHPRFKKQCRGWRK
jgi:hypothetical protein